MLETSRPDRCSGPNIKCLAGAYWDFWDHQLLLTGTSLAEALRTADFLIYEAIERFLPYAMVDGRRCPLLCLRIYLRLPSAWRLFGKQFLVIGSKPG